MRKRLSLSLSLGGVDCLCPRSMSEASGRTDWHALVTPEHLMTCQAMFARAHLMAEHLAMRGTTRHCQPLPSTTRLGTTSSLACFTVMENHAAAAFTMQPIPRLNLTYFTNEMCHTLPCAHLHVSPVSAAGGVRHRRAAGGTGTGTGGGPSTGA
jgi:hypothetical protein